MPAPEGELLFKAGVVRSVVSRTAPCPGESAPVIYQYHSGIEFVGLTSGVDLALQLFLASPGETPSPA